MYGKYKYASKNTKYIAVSWENAHVCSTINSCFSPYWEFARYTGCLQCVKLEQVGLIFMSMALGTFVDTLHSCACAHTCMHALYRARCMTFYANYKRYKGLCTVEPLGSCYLCACPGVGAFHSNSQNGYVGAYRGVGTCLGHYGK